MQLTSVYRYPCTSNLDSNKTRGEILAQKMASNPWNLESDLFHFSDLPLALGLDISLSTDHDNPDCTLTSQDLLGLLGSLPSAPSVLAMDIKRGEQHVFEGVIIQEISWWVGFGPRTQAYLLKSEGSIGKARPGILYCHR